MTAEKPADLQLGYMLVDVVRLLRRDFYSRTTGIDLTPALVRLLIAVHRQPGAKQSDLAAHLDITPVTLGRMVDRLVARGYVQRRADRTDRRAVRVCLAPAAEPLVARMQEISKLTTTRATRGLTGPERAALLDLLARVQTNLTEPGP